MEVNGTHLKHWRLRSQSTSSISFSVIQRELMNNDLKQNNNSVWLSGWSSSDVINKTKQQPYDCVWLNWRAVCGSVVNLLVFYFSLNIHKNLMNAILRRQVEPYLPRPGLVLYLLLTVWTWSDLLLLTARYFTPLSSVLFGNLPDRKIKATCRICEGMDKLCMYNMQENEAWHLEEGDWEGGREIKRQK